MECPICGSKSIAIQKIKVFNSVIISALKDDPDADKFACDIVCSECLETYPTEVWAEEFLKLYGENND